MRTAWRVVAYIICLSTNQLLIDIQILRISIYVNLDDISQIEFGRRSNVYPRTADLKALVEQELADDRRELQDMKMDQAGVPRQGPSKGVGHLRLARGRTVNASTRQSTTSAYSTNINVQSNRVSPRFDTQSHGCEMALTGARDHHDRYIWPDKLLFIGEFSCT
jgi:hypothetical protein